MSEELMSRDGAPATQAPAPGCGQAPAASSGCGQAPDAPGSLDATQMRAWRAFLQASTTVTAALNHELDVEAGISLHEYEILVRLCEAEGRTLRMSALADGVAHSRSRLTHTVVRLEKAGYVERRSCASDRRGVNCHLTDAGLAFLRATAPAHLAGVRRHLLDRLDRDQLTALTTLLEAVTAPEAPAGPPAQPTPR